MISPTSGTVTFGVPFSVTISVFSESESTDPDTGLPVTTQEPSTTLPVVTASFNDPGVTITPSIGQVIIAGTYQTIIQTSWSFIDLSGNKVTQPQAPTVGTFKTIFKVDSPPRLTETCTYTIDGSPFVHTVSLGGYSGIANTLKSLMATV
jgi:hypothetical protein